MMDHSHILTQLSHNRIAELYRQQHVDLANQPLASLFAVPTATNSHGDISLYRRLARVVQLALKVLHLSQRLANRPAEPAS